MCGRRFIQTIESSSINGLQTIREASQEGLTVCFPGVGSAFAKKNDHTCLIIAKNGVTTLGDAGTSTPRVLLSRGIEISDFEYYHITHSHADHIGGLEQVRLYSRYVLKKKPRLILAREYKDILWEQSLRGGCGYCEGGVLQFDDLAEIIYIKNSSCRWEIHK